MRKSSKVYLVNFIFHVFAFSRFMSGRVHTLMEKRKAKKRKPIRIHGKTEADKRNVSSTTTASSDWLPFFCFLFFHQGVNRALKPGRKLD